MDITPLADQIKKTRFSLFINSCIAVYAICSFISALKTGVAWRMLLSGTGSAFFIVAIVMLAIRLAKLRKAE